MVVMTVTHLYFFLLIVVVTREQLQLATNYQYNMEFNKRNYGQYEKVRFVLLSYFLQLYQWLLWMLFLDINLAMILQDFEGLNPDWVVAFQTNSAQKQQLIAMAFLTILMQFAFLLLTIFNYSNDKFINHHLELKPNFQIESIPLKILQFLVIFFQNSHSLLINIRIDQIQIVLNFFIFFIILKSMIQNTLHNDLNINKIHMSVFFVFSGKFYNI